MIGGVAMQHARDAAPLFRQWPPWYVWLKAQEQPMDKGMTMAGPRGQAEWQTYAFQVCGCPVCVQQRVNNGGSFVPP